MSENKLIALFIGFSLCMQKIKTKKLNKKGFEVVVISAFMIFVILVEFLY